jgi:O-acetyl-ADP-ribose deacetylase (regulator of RNase III)
VFYGFQAQPQGEDAMPEAVLEGTQINRSVVRVIKGDITDLEVDAFVFYAQPDLALGSGFGGAIGMRGGASIQKELDELSPVEIGEAVVTEAGKMKASYIIHAVGPRFQEEDIEPKLRATLKSSLARAEEKGVRSLALPAMGSGYYGIPADVSARVTFEVLKGHLNGDSGLTEVVVCVLDTPQYNSFGAALAALN